MPAYYPIFLDLRGRKVVVVGGGDLGEEKVNRLLPYAAHVTVIAPEVNSAVRLLSEQGQISWIDRAYAPGDLEGATIAIVADTSDNDTNLAVSQEADTRNIPLNVADVTELCTWITPSVAKRGDVIIATSTGGASPALARKFREMLSGTHLMPVRKGIMEFADLAPLLSDVRKELLDKGIRLYLDHWQACITDELVTLVQTGQNEEARSRLMDDLLVGVTCGCTNNVCQMYEDKALPSATVSTP